MFYLISHGENGGEAGFRADHIEEGIKIALHCISVTLAHREWKAVTVHLVEFRGNTIDLCNYTGIGERDMIWAHSHTPSILFVIFNVSELLATRYRCS